MQYFFRRVRDIKHRNFEVGLELLKPRHNLGLPFEIQRRQRLVGQDNGWFGNKGTRNCHTLALTARELSRLSPEKAANAQ